MNTLASLQHPNLCKLLGFHAREGSDQKMLVYERLFHGSLDRLLYGRSDGPPIDWNTRMKIALCAAQGLTFLHEEGPFQVIKIFLPVFLCIKWTKVNPLDCAFSIMSILKNGGLLNLN